MNFNEKLIKLRKENGFSQEELGQKLNVARQTVSKWELGETTPDMNKLISLSQLFEISLDELLRDVKVQTNINNTNTQKLAGIIILIIKIFGIFIAAMIIISIISVTVFSTNKTATTIDNENVIYEIE